MAVDDLKVREASTGRSVRADDVGGKLVQVVKLLPGGDGQDQGFVSQTRGLPVSNPSGEKLAVDPGRGDSEANPVYVLLSGPIITMQGEPPAYELSADLGEATLPEAAENLSRVSLSHSGTGSVNLQTLNFGGAQGRIIVVDLSPDSPGVVTLEDSTGGNIRLGSAFVMDDDAKRILLQWIGTEWIEIGRSGPGLGTIDASDVVSGTMADARIAESNVTQHADAVAAAIRGNPAQQYVLAADMTTTALVGAPATLLTGSFTKLLSAAKSKLKISIFVSGSNDTNDRGVAIGIDVDGTPKIWSMMVGRQNNQRHNSAALAWIEGGIAAGATVTVSIKWYVESDTGRCRPLTRPDESAIMIVEEIPA